MPANRSRSSSSYRGRGRSRTTSPAVTRAKSRGRTRTRATSRMRSTSTRRSASYASASMNAPTKARSRMPKAKKKLDKRILKYVNAGKGRGHYKKEYTEWKYASSGTDNAANRQGVYSFNHCQPMQLLDAISVLFNGKAANKDYNITTDNFSGDPDFTISSCVTTYKVTNTSQVPVTLELYPFLAKQDTSKSPIDAWQDSISENLQPATPIVRPTWYGMKATDVPGELGRYWSGVGKMKTVTIEPGKSKVVHKFVSGFMDVNWEDFQVGNTVLQYKKGISQVLTVVHKIPVSYDTYGNKVVVPTGAGSDFYGGLCWEIYEDWHAICPQVATHANNKDVFTLLHGYDAPSEQSVFIYPSKPPVRNVYEDDWVTAPTGGVFNDDSYGIAS